MKKLNVLAIVAIFAMGFASVSCNSQKSVSLKTETDSVCYLIGALNGAGFRENIKTFPGGPANVDAYLDGFYKAVKGDSTLLSMSRAEVEDYVNNFFQSAQQKDAETILAEGTKFLEENKSKPGVITTESGLQYKVITEGTGAKPSLEDTVLVHYTGKLLDGSIFDSSVERNEPIKFPLNGVIRGWSEGVQLMPKGSKYQLWIPAELAYGMNPPTQSIKPNSTLEFEVELLDIFKAKK